MSTHSRPKQLLSFDGERTLVGRTLDRVAQLVDLGGSLAVTSASLRAAIAAELPRLPPERVVGEPVGRNTAPAIALAARLLWLRDPAAVLVVLPADHLVLGDDGFRDTVEVAIRAAEDERALVTIGVPPTRVETEYGYVMAGGASATPGVRRVTGFVEKPDAASAEAYVASGDCYWNSGVFVWRADRFLDAVGQLLPDVARAAERVSAEPGDPGFEDELRDYYAAVPGVSVDYGIMERSADVLVVPARFTWDDVGAWPALSRVWGVDAAGNAVRGNALVLDSHGCVVYAEDGAIAVLGMSDVVVARAGGATLVCPKERARDVRRIVEEMRRGGGGAGER